MCVTIVKRHDAILTPEWTEVKVEDFTAQFGPGQTGVVYSKDCQREVNCSLLSTCVLSANCHCELTAQWHCTVLLQATPDVLHTIITELCCS